MLYFVVCSNSVINGFIPIGIRCTNTANQSDVFFEQKVLDLIVTHQNYTADYFVQIAFNKNLSHILRLFSLSHCLFLTDHGVVSNEGYYCSSCGNK